MGLRQTTDTDMMFRYKHLFRLVNAGALAMTSCLPLRDTGVVRPEDGSDLTAVASTQTPEVFEGADVTLAADAVGGTPIPERPNSLST